MTASPVEPDLRQSVQEAEHELRKRLNLTRESVSFRLKETLEADGCDRISVTSTNWMCGLWAAVARWPWRRALQISINAVFVVGVIWAV